MVDHLKSSRVARAHCRPNAHLGSISALAVRSLHTHILPPEHLSERTPRLRAAALPRAPGAFAAAKSPDSCCPHFCSWLMRKAMGSAGLALASAFTAAFSFAVTPSELR